jgi:hypothetical protein
MVAAAGREYEILIFRHDHFVRTIRRNIPPRAATREMALRQLATGWKINGCQVAAGELDRIGYANTLPAIEALRFAPGGDLWVARGRVADEPTMIDLFNPAGEYKGTLPRGTPFPVAFVDSDTYVTVEHGPAGHALTAYRLVRP